MAGKRWIRDWVRDYLGCIEGEQDEDEKGEGEIRGGKKKKLKTEV